MTQTDQTEQGITDSDAVFESEAEALDAFVAAPPAPVKRGVGWGVVLPLFLLAGFGGAVGGWALTQYVMPKYVPLPQAATSIAETPQVNLAPLTARIETLEKKLAAQSSELSFLSSEVKSGAASVTVGGVDETLDITPLMNRLAQLEQRLETRSTPLIAVRPETTELPSETPTLENSDISESPETSENPELLENIENADTTEAQETIISPAPAIAKNYDDEIASLELRLDKLEMQVEETRTLAAEPNVVRDTILLPPFPREALLEAMTAPRDQQAQSWLDRTLKKHISVRNPQDVARANETLDRIEALVEARDYAAALALVEAMQSDVRSPANEWMRALKVEIKTSP